MRTAVWAVQFLLASVFGAAGALKLFAFERFATAVPELAAHQGLVSFIGVAELAEAVGLILPAFTGILPFLTTWAAIGLAMIMALATAFHIIPLEVADATVPAILGLLAGFVIWGRGRADQDPRNLRRS